MTTYLGKRNAINNLYENATAINSNYSGTNYASGDGKVNSAFSGIDTQLGVLKSANEFYVDTSGTLTDEVFGTTILADTALGSALTRALPDPTGITDQVITVVNAPTGTKIVTLTTPVGAFGNLSVSSTLILYPGDSVKLMTLGTFGYQILSWTSGASNGVYVNVPTASVLALGSTPIVAAPTPGANKIILFQGMGSTWRVNFNSVAFAAGAAVQIRLGTATVGALGVVGNATVGATSIMCGLPITNTQIQSQASFVDQPLMIGTASNVNFTTGNGSFEFWLRYRVQSLV